MVKCEWGGLWHGGTFYLDMRTNDVCANLLCRVKFQEQGFWEIRDTRPKVRAKNGPPKGITWHKDRSKVVKEIQVD